MKWTRYSGDTITADGYTISRYVLGDQHYYTARDPSWQTLLSYWGESADRAKEACRAHKEQVTA